MSSKFAVTSALVLAGLIAASCGKQSDVANPGKLAPASERAAIPFAATSDSGTVEYEGERGWQKLADRPTLSVRGLRASGRGGIATLHVGEDQVGTVWMRGGTELQFSQNGGKLFAHLKAGEARVALAHETKLYAVVQSGSATPIADAVLAKRADGTIDVFNTDLRPELATWTLTLDEPATATGIGRMERRRDGAMELIELRRVVATAKIEGDLAVTEVEHIFWNDEEERIEGTFRFPLPDGAILVGLAMEINGRMMEGEFVEREKARTTYESIVDSMRDPALLEWEQGGWFKLRVFPLEPKAEKRLLLRYAQPLRRGATGYEYRFSAATPDLQSSIPHLKVVVDGDVVFDEKNVRGPLDVTAPIDSSSITMTATQKRKDGVYTSMVVAPEWAPEKATQALAGPARVIYVVDTSRSSLETSDLAQESLAALLGELSPADEFALLTADIAVRHHTSGFQPATDEAIAAALSAVSATERDGASDIATALRTAGEMAEAGAQIVYIGDGTPTWGATDATELERIAAQALAKSELSAVVLGRGASIDMWRNLAGARGGRALRPTSAVEAEQAAFVLARSRSLPRLRDVTVAAEGAELYPRESATLYPGDHIRVVMRSEAGAALPDRVTVRGYLGEQQVTFQMPLESPAPGSHVAQRWGSAKLAAMVQSDASKEEIVETSIRLGVLSKHTSLLVLESEKMYEEFEIERRRAEEEAAANAPAVTGGDLESLNGESASLSPDHIQPGDPEILVPAPADARSVVVIFPFGDTKIAEYDGERGSWVVRFLIDKETPDGVYHVLVRITNADGSVESLRLPYTVDTVAPRVNLTVTKIRGRRYRIEATQRFVEDERAGDLKRVEVILPSGTPVYLRRGEDGTYSRELVSRFPLENVTLKVITTDGAFNQRTEEFTIR